MDESTARSRHPNSLAQTFLWALLLTLLLVLNAPNASYGQVVVTTDITATTTAPLNLGTHVDSVGTTTQITGGTRPNNGTNLFHSFDSFTLGTGDIAHFMNDMQLPTTNIVGRVIGGEVSTIDGTLRTNNPLNAADPMNFGAANLWLVNPSGLLLGPNARIEVGGSVSMSTANYLRFEGTTALFDMLSSPASLGPLSVAPVAAFGFLPVEPGATRGTISVQGSNLQVPEGQALSLVGGDITVQAASLRAPGGQLNLVSVASPGEVLVPSFQTGSFTPMGTVMLTEGATLDVSGQLEVDAQGNPIGGNSGTVFVRGGQLVMDASTIVATTVGPVNGASSAVDIQVSQNVALINGAAITSLTSGLGRGGEVQITAGTIGLDGAAALITQTDGDGNAGNLILNVGTLTLDNSATISSKSNPFFTPGHGQGGDVTIQGLPVAGGGPADPPPAAESVTLSNGATITSLTFGLGDGGNILITSGAVQLNNVDTSINSFTFNFGEAGAGGDITLKVSTLTLTDLASIQSQSTTPFPRFGQGGDVTIQGLPVAGGGPADPPPAATLVDFSGGSMLVSQTTGSGNGGRVDITSESLKMDGVANIFSSTFGTGLGGNILVRVGEARLSGGANIKGSTDLLDSGAGASGTITVQGLKEDGIKADLLTLTGPGTGLFSSSFGAGNLGKIVVNAKTVSLTDAAAIQVGTQLDTAETAGNVTIDADSVGISGGGRIASQVLAADAGQVTIKATQLTLDNGSIETNTFGDGLGGNVVLNVGTVSLSNGAKINSSTSNVGRAGDINILASGSATMTNGSTITASSTGSGDAGQVVITTPTLNVDNATINTNTTSSGNAGSITAKVGTLTLTNGAEMSSSSTGDATGAAGSVTIQGLASPANAMMVTDSALLTSAANTGQGGSITVDATNLALKNATISASVKNFDKSPDSTDSASVGLGNIDLTASTMTMNGSTVTTESSGLRNAGDIRINPQVAGGSFEIQNSAINTSASLSDGGNIEINVNNMFRMTNSVVTSSVGNPGKTDTTGGNITIDPQFVILQGSQIKAQAFAGAGGNIDIISNVFLADPFSQQNVSASSQLGISGTVDIRAPVQNVSGELVVLSQDFASAASLLAQQCAARVADGKFSTFVVAAREGLPVEPGGFLPSPSFPTELVGPVLSWQLPQTTRSVAEGLFPQYDAKPLQLAKLGNSCRR